MPRDVEINERSRVPLNFLYGGIVGTAGLVLACASLFYSIKSDLSELKRHLNDDWTTRDQEVWVSELKDRNPTLNVPRPSALKSASTAPVGSVAIVQ